MIYRLLEVCFTHFGKKNDVNLIFKNRVVNLMVIGVESYYIYEVCIWTKSDLKSD